MSEVFELTFAVERRAPDASGRYPVVISTDAPVDMGDVIEILSHEPGAINTSRFPLPLLLNHERDKHIGTVENPSVTDGKLRAWIRFASGQLASEVEADVKNGIRRNLSVGYYRHKVVKSEDEQSGRLIVHTVSWQPYEASIVAVPADELAGVGRSLKLNGNDMTTTTSNNDARRAAELEEIDGFAKRYGDAYPAVRDEHARIRPLANGDNAALAAMRKVVLAQISHTPVDTGGFVSSADAEAIGPGAMRAVCAPLRTCTRRQSGPASVTSPSRSCARRTRR